MGITSQLALFLEMDYLRMLNCSRYKIGYVELMCGESNKTLHLVDRSYDLT